ncbi:VanZ family protein [Bosea thiooxidans]
MLKAFVCNHGRKIALAAGWVVLAVIVWASLSPIGSRPHSGLAINLERELAFALLGAMFVLAGRIRPLPLLALLIAFVAGLELLQNLTPTRHGRFDDALVKALGVTVGVALGATVQAWARRAERSRR